MKEGQKLSIAIVALAFMLTTNLFAQETPVLEWAVGTATNSSNIFESDTKVDGAGNVYTTGSFRGTMDFDPGPATFNITSAGQTDIFLLKLDPNGNFIWVKTMGSTGDDERVKMVLDGSGNIYMTGSFSVTVDFDPNAGVTNMTSQASYDVFVLKLDINGNFIWVKSFRGSSYDQAAAIHMHTSGDIIVGGQFSQTADFDPGAGTYSFTAGGSFGYSDGFVVRLTNNGDFVWAAQLGGPNTDDVVDVDVDASGNIYAMGGFQGFGDFDPGSSIVYLTGAVSGQDFFLAKLDANGAYVWAKVVMRITDVGGFANNPYSISLDGVGGVYFAGAVGAGMTVDLDPSAAEFTIGGVANRDVALSKLDTDGNFAWARKLVTNGSPFRYGNPLLGTPTGLYVAGGFGNVNDFDPGPGTYNMSSGDGSAFIAKLALDGSLIWARQTNGSVLSLANSPSGSLYISGNLIGTGDFDPSPCKTFSLTGTNSIYHLKINLPNIPPHTITSFTPSAGAVGTTVTITGTNFSLVPADNIVKFNNVTQAVVTASTATTLTVTVPVGAISGGRIYVTLNCLTVASAAAFFLPPAITSFTPTSGPVTTTVTITGTNFSSTAANNTVQFNGTTATVTGSSTTSITTRVPAGATTGNITVTVSGNTATSATPFTVTTDPVIISFSPSGSGIGVTVTINGANFSTTPANNTVRFNGTNVTVQSSSATTITTRVPTGATTGPITVTVGGITATSVSNYTILGSPVITITSQPQDAYVCVGSVATFSTAASGTTNIVYQWQYSPTLSGTYNDITNDSHYSNTATSTLSVNTADIFGDGYYFRCKVNGDGAATKFTTPRVLRVVVITEKSDVASSSRCGPGEITVSKSGVDSEEFNWYQADGTPIEDESGETLTRTLSVTTTFLVAVNSGMCEGPRVPITAIINPVPSTPVISSSITPIGGTVTFCSSNSLTLSAPAGFSSYAWSNGATTQQINVNFSGNYTLRVTNSEGCQSLASAPVNVTILSAPCSNNPPVISEASATTEIEGKVSLSLSSFVSDSDNNLDIQSLKVKKQPVSGARASVTNSILEVDYEGLSFSGTDVLGIEACDLLGSCTQKDISIEVIGDYVVYNGISPNGDGQNDFWFIQYIDAIEETKNNKVSIFNRWGDEVFSVSNYNNDDKVFKGLNNNGSELASGVYYYKIEFSSGRLTKTGYLALKK